MIKPDQRPVNILTFKNDSGDIRNINGLFNEGYGLMILHGIFGF